MNKKWIGSLLVGSLLAFQGYPCLAQDLAEDIGTVGQGVIEDVGDLIEDMGEVNPEEIDPDLLLALQKADWNEIASNLQAIQSVLESEELEGLLAYTKEHAEMQEFFFSLAEEMIRFQHAEPELTREILVAMELDPIYLNLYDAYLEMGTEFIPILRAFLSTKSGQRLTLTAEEYIGTGNLDTLLTLLAELEEAPKESENTQEEEK